MTLGDNQKQLEQAYKTIQTGNHIPQEVATEPNTPTSTVTGESAYSTKVLEMNAELKRASDVRKDLEAFARQQQSTLRTKPKPPATGRRNLIHTTTEGWQSWTFWCYTHGTNLTHNSPACNRPQTGHKQAATKLNPMGGNTSRDHLHDLWCHPTQRSIHTSPNT